MISCIRRTSLFFKSVSIFIILTFMLTNVGFSQPSSVSSNFVTSEENTKQFLNNNQKEVVKVEDDTLSPIARIFMNDNDELVNAYVQTAQALGMEDAGAIQEPLQRQEYQSVKMATEKWIDKKAKEVEAEYQTEKTKEWVSFLESDRLWGMVLSNCLSEFGLGLKNELTANNRQDEFEGRYASISDIIINIFGEIREAQLGKSAHGKEHIKRGVQTPFVGEARDVVEKAIALTIERMKDAIALPDTASTMGAKEKKRFLEKQFEREYMTIMPTGGKFVSLPAEIYKQVVNEIIQKKLKTNNLSGTDLETFEDMLTQAYYLVCHPGTRGTGQILKSIKGEKSKEVAYNNQVDRFYYAIDSDFDKLTPEEKLIWANHEEMHLKISLGLISLPEGENEEEWINGHTESDVREIMARLGSTAHMEELLVDDSIYGERAIERINEAREQIQKLEARHAQGTALTFKKGLANWIRTVYERINVFTTAVEAGKIKIKSETQGNLTGEKRFIRVPAGFTITTEEAKTYLKQEEKDKQLRPEVINEIDKQIKQLEKATGKKLGDPDNPLLVSVRSGARISMPGMMETVLNVGLNDETVTGLAKKFGGKDLSEVPLEEKTGQDAAAWRFAYDSYRRGIMMTANVVMDKERKGYDRIFDEKKKEMGVTNDNELTAKDLMDVVEKFKALFKEQTGIDYPQDAHEQVRLAVKAVFDSSAIQRAMDYRRMFNIPFWTTLSAVNVQEMVFGNMNDNSATGVAFSRDPATGENVFYGEFLVNAQGEDVVAGVRTPMPINKSGKGKFLEQHREYIGREHEIKTLQEIMPEAYNELEAIYKELEKKYNDMQDIEFTIQDGVLYMLQTRVGKRTAAAALNIAMDLYEEGRLDKDEVIMRMSTEQINEFLHPIFDPKAKKRAKTDKKIIAKGLPASPGASVGQIVFNPEEAVKLKKESYTIEEAMDLVVKQGYKAYDVDRLMKEKFMNLQEAQEVVAEEIKKESETIDPATGKIKGKRVALIRVETIAEDVAGMEASEVIVTDRGGMTSHAAVVARGMGKNAVVGVNKMNIDYEKGQATIDGKVYRTGDLISVDGYTGEIMSGDVQTKDSIVISGLRGEKLEGEDLKLFERYLKLFDWVDEIRGEKTVRTNAEKVNEVEDGVVLFDADGIGLARTEHMFFKDRNKDENRLAKFRKMILTGNITAESLKELAEYQINDFADIFKITKEKPVTIRLLDPPLHEFLPPAEEPKEEKAKVEWNKTMDELEKELGLTRQEIINKIHALEEANPMAGFRGDRLAIVYPEIAKMQVRAILKAHTQVREEGKREGYKVAPAEIMVPLVSSVEEFRFFKALIMKIAEEEFGLEYNKDYTVGTMIEVPQAAIIGDELAKEASFFSFGTNDLTQFVFKFSRDDAGNLVIPVYMGEEVGVLKVDPFITVDEIVGEYVKMATALARKVNPKIKIGLCGEQGGNEQSIQETIMPAGLNYTSCSPFRVPIAKLSIAQKRIKDKRVGKSTSVISYDLKKIEPAYAEFEPANVIKAEGLMSKREPRTEEVKEDSMSLMRKLILIQATPDAVLSKPMRKTLTDAIVGPLSEKIKEEFNGVLKKDPHAMIRLYNQSLGEEFKDITEKEIDELEEYFGETIKVKTAIKKLKETNAAMGNLGVRQQFTGYSAAFKAQIQTMIKLMKENNTYNPRVIVPLVVDAHEFKLMKDIIHEMCEEAGVDKGRIYVGASLETGRAIFQAQTLAKDADFLVCDTIGLTESLMATTQEDAKSFLPTFVEMGLYKDDPFKVVSPQVKRAIGIFVRGALGRNADIPLYFWGHDELSLEEYKNASPIEPIQDKATYQELTDKEEELLISYFFGLDQDGTNLTQGNAAMKDLLGGKGANLAEMAQIIVDFRAQEEQDIEKLLSEDVMNIKTKKSIPITGRDAFDALKETEAGRQAIIMAINMRTPLVLDGLMQALKETDSFVLFQQAMSELGYTWPKGYTMENVYELVKEIAEAAKRNGFDGYAMKGDHITVKVDKDFLADDAAKKAVAELMEKILEEENLEARAMLFQEAMNDKKFMANKNVENGMKAIKKAYDLVITEVDAGMTVFALDASWMPNRLNVVCNSFLDGFIPKSASHEAEVGEIGGKENSTVADVLEFITGIRYDEVIKTDPKTKAKYSELVYDENGEPVVLSKGKGILDYGVRLDRLAINNNTEHGNNYDAEGNLIVTKMNLKMTAAIAKVLAPYGIEIVQHGVTNTPVENLAALRAAGIKVAHIATHWQNLAWGVIVEAAKSNDQVQNLVDRIIDTIISKAGSKYNVVDKETAKQKDFDKMIGKELKTIFGQYKEELNALPADVKAEITRVVKKSAIEHIKAVRCAGTAGIIKDYIKRKEASIIDEKEESIMVPVIEQKDIVRSVEAYVEIEKGTGDSSDVIKLHDEKIKADKLLSIVGDKEHVATVVGGEMVITLNGESLNDRTDDAIVLTRGDQLSITKEAITATLVNGDKYTLPLIDAKTAVDYTINKVSKAPVILDVKYDTEDAGKAAYNVYETIKEKDILERVLANKIDLIMPQDSFEGTGSKSKQQVQKQYDDTYGKGVVNVVAFISELEQDLQKAIENSIASGRIPVLASTQEKLKGIESAEAKKSLEKARILPLADTQNILMDTLGGIALLQAALNAKDIEDKESAFAQKMLRLMSNLTGTELSVSDLYYLLPFSDDAIPADIKTSDVVNWLQKIFEKLPMIKLVGTVSEEFQKRLRFMYSA